MSISYVCHRYIHKKSTRQGSKTLPQIFYITLDVDAYFRQMHPTHEKKLCIYTIDVYS